MTHRIAAATLLIAGLVHLLPVTGVLGAVRLEALYGVTAADATTLLLLRHRAMLFGVLGVALVIAAFRPAWHVAACVVALVSVLSFLVLASGDAGLTPAVARVVLVDRIVAVVLAAGLAAALAGARDATRLAR